jgi:hypothetical protein
LLSERAKEGANVFGEQLGLFEGSEMAPARHFRPALNV